MRVRDGMKAYTGDIRRKITDNRADDVLIDLISLREFLSRNSRMRAFTEELAAICGAGIDEISPESDIRQLRWLGKQTLGDLQKMLGEDHDLALAKKTLGGTDLDILSASVGLRFLCRAALVNSGYTPEQAADFLKLSMGDTARAGRQAKHLFHSVRKSEDENA